MTERLDERVGDPRTIHPEGKPYSAGTYGRGCRCEHCKAAKANQYQMRKGRPPRINIPGTELKRPPGVVWLDWSGITAVVRCERCDKNYGVWLDRKSASEFREAHALTHYADPPFDWSAYDTQRIMKNPGGRPPVDQPECNVQGCLEDARALGMCDTHYRAHKRALAASEALAAKAQAEYEERQKNPPKRVYKPRPKAAALCSAPMCGSRPVKGKYCEAHS